VFDSAGLIEGRSGESYSKGRYSPIPGRTAAFALAAHSCQERYMAKIAKTADRKKVMDTTKSTACPKCGKETRIVKRMKDRERGVPGGIYISCSGCEFFEKL
jgi:DNA-directed RNA polymerase subunit M/transcription elongation factor TFIIS